jgi:hypothetical protein
MCLFIKYEHTENNTISNISDCLFSPFLIFLFKHLYICLMYNVICCLFFFDIRILIASLWYLQTRLPIFLHSTLFHKSAYQITMFANDVDMLCLNITRTSQKSGGELRCPGRVGRSCSTSDTRRVNLVINPVISHE